jgi:hypothetical protein
LVVCVLARSTVWMMQSLKCPAGCGCSCACRGSASASKRLQAGSSQSFIRPDLSTCLSYQVL